MDTMTIENFKKFCCKEQKSGAIARSECEDMEVFFFLNKEDTQEYAYMLIEMRLVMQKESALICVRSLRNQGTGIQSTSKGDGL